MTGALVSILAASGLSLSGPGVVPLSQPVAPAPAALADWSLAAGLAAGLGDPFHAKLVPGIALRRGWGLWGLELWGARGLNWRAPAAAICTTTGGCVGPPEAAVDRLPGRVGWIGALSAVARPAHGKVSFGAAASRSFALEGQLGGGVVQALGGSGSSTRNVTPALRWAIGLSGGLTSASRLRLAVGGLIYAPQLRAGDPWLHQWLISCDFEQAVGHR